MDKFITIISLIFLTKLCSVECHGRLLNPIARGSRWRFNSSAPTDYNDNEAFCGGYGVHWINNKGKCGFCGDNFADKAPRIHEFGGTYGEGIIVANYKAGSEMNIDVQLTANHRGYFMYDICNLDANAVESEKCFLRNRLALKSGGYIYKLPTFAPAWFNTTVKIPKNLICNHCVLRWTYITGNTWGHCDDGTSGMGCGPQENFKGCADIAIMK